MNRYIVLIVGLVLVSTSSAFVYRQLIREQPAPVVQESPSTSIPEATVSTTPVQDLAAASVRSAPLIDCIGPDGKHAQATQVDCDNLNNFWNAQNPAPASTSNTGGQSSTTGGSSSTPTPTQAPSQSGSDATPTLTPTPTPEPITVSTTSVVVTLSRANAQYSLVYGSGFTVTSHGATGWAIKYTEPTQGQGFYESSGGITQGNSYSIRAYVSTNKPNGTYTGSAVVRYEKDGSWQDGPTVSYTIALTD